VSLILLIIPFTLKKVLTIALLFVAVLSYTQDGRVHRSTHSPTYKRFEAFNDWNAIHLNGEAAYISIKDQPAIDFDTALTIETWLNVANVNPTKDYLIVNKGWCEPDNNDAAYNLSIRKGKLTVTWHNNGLCGIEDGAILLTDSSSTELFPSDSCLHVAAMVTPSLMKLYIDGKLVGTHYDQSLSNKQFYNSSQPLRIGAYKFSSGALGHFFHGKLSEFRIWNTARTQEQIQANRSRRLVGNEEGLVVYFPFDRGMTSEGAWVYNQAHPHQDKTHPVFFNYTTSKGLPSNTIYDLYQSSTKYLWAATDGGLCRFNGYSFTTYHNQEQKGNAVSGIREDTQGRIWVRNFQQQLFYLEADSLHYFEELEDIPEQKIQDFIITPQNELWILPFRGDQLYKYQITAQQWDTIAFPPTQLTTTTYNKSIVYTPNRTVIISTNKGIYQWTNSQLQLVLGSQTEEEHNYFLHATNNDIYVLEKFDHNFRIHTLQADTLLAYSNKAFYQKILREKSSPNALRQIEDKLWLLTLQNGTAASSTVSPIPTNWLFPNEGISDIIQDHEGNYWFSSLDNGLYFVPNIDAHMHSIPQLPNPPNKNPLEVKNATLQIQGQDRQAQIVYKSPDGRWLAQTATNDLYLLSPSKEVLQHIDKALLPKDYKNIQLKGNRLWMTLADGLLAIDLNSKQSYLYDTKDGLPTQQIEDYSLTDKKIWLKSLQGVATFDESLPATNRTPPPIYLTEIWINNKPAEVVENTINLLHDQNNITVRFEGISFRSQGLFHYEYRMMGLDTTWVAIPNDSTTLSFQGLSPNQYIFEVVAVNEDGVRSATPAQLTIQITPAYWQTWWFWSIIVLSVSIVIVIALLIRNLLIQQRERRENKYNVLRMQALQAQMNPHFIFNVLTAVQNLWLQKKTEVAMSLQADFAKLLRKIFQYSNKQAIRIEQVEDFLQNYLNLERIRFENNVTIQFDIEGALFDDEYRIPPLLIQPIIENSFKHGLLHKDGEKKLVVQLKAQGPYLYCLVEDNGVGRKNPTPLKRVSGLSTTIERLAILQETFIKKTHPHQNIRITDLKDDEGHPLGTRVEMWIPFFIQD